MIFNFTIMKKKMLVKKSSSRVSVRKCHRIQCCAVRVSSRHKSSFENPCLFGIRRVENPHITGK